MHGIIFNVTQNPFLSRPLGGHRIAHYLRERGWDIEVVDWSNWWQLEQLQELFRSRYSKSTVWVGFGHLFSMWSPVLEEFGSWIKQNYAGVYLISGSAVNPMFRSNCIDYYIQGFGELAIENLLKYLVGNGPRPRFNLNAPHGIKIISAIQSYPAFPMKDLMVRYEDRDYIKVDEWLTIETARGCKFSCAFCNFPVLGVRDDHTRDSDNFKMQLRDAHDRFGVTNYIIADETFNDSVGKITKFADAVQELDFEVWFSGYVRADLMISRREDREQLLRMNFLGHYYGIESMNTRSARSIGKGMDSDRIKQGLIDIRKYFESHGSGRYRGSMGLIVGLPDETESSVMNTLSWLIDHWQGHSFSMHPLSLPAPNNINHDSKMSKNPNKYGYDIMTHQQIEALQKNSQTEVQTSFSDIIPPAFRKNLEEELIWKNKNMTWFDARRICSHVAEVKAQHDFRPSCHALSYRLTNHGSIKQRLDLGFDRFDSQLNFDIQPYIDLKLTQ